MTHRATLLAFAAIGLWMVPHACGYSIVGRWPQPGDCGLANCPGAPVTLTYSYQNMFDGGLRMANGHPLPNGLIRHSIEEALGLWASVAPLHFVEVPDDSRPYNQGSTQYGRIRFRHVFINGPDPPPPALPTTKARAYFPSTSGTLPGDVEFDHGDPWRKVGTLSRPDILGAAIHEIGHALGVGHSSIDGVNMYWIFHRFSGPGTGQLFQDDINGIRAIYGSGVGSVTPLFVSAPEPATTLLLAFTVGWWWISRRSR